MSPVLQAFLPSFLPSAFIMFFIPLTGLVQCCSDSGCLNRNADDDAHELQPITIVSKGLARHTRPAALQ
jgi:hypothetical protein